MLILIVKHSTLKTTDPERTDLHRSGERNTQDHHHKLKAEWNTIGANISFPPEVLSQRSYKKWKSLEVLDEKMSQECVPSGNAYVVSVY